MHSSLVIANRFIELAAGENRTLTHMQVQKLVYFAHALFLVVTNHPLIGEYFLAYPFGPVEPTLYDKLRSYGSTFISQIPDVKPDQLSITEEKVIESVYKKYGHLDAYALSNISHIAEGPWDKAWKNHKFSLISNSSICAFYGAK